MSSSDFSSPTDNSRPSRDRLDLVYRLSQTFNSSLDLNQVLNTVIDEVISLMNAERGFVMLVKPHSGLDFRAARGIDQQSIDHPDFQISRSIVEKVRHEGVPILTVDAQKDDRFARQQSIIALGLRSILCVPLKSKQNTIGIIYVDHSLMSGLFTTEDLELLTAVASSASVAIENAGLYENLEQSKIDLEVAYDTTLEGWAKALELRDQVTEGHTRRVTQMTVRLAASMSINSHELNHIRRGALLHDIGKMGIPDQILLKPGPLTIKEYETMKMHPVFAYEMLSQIAFLKPALDIPYCHHERWDGSGYPRGLKGEQIPMAARIFSVVDVWDALHSNRPYRKEWPMERILQYLTRQAGSQFDPSVVQSFIRLITTKTLLQSSK
jgi:HD-GYP domain-containing protein (c-di-GMP phosphodiesterase class II)